MARLISTNISQDLFGIIKVTHEDLSVDTKEIRVGDTVTNLRYIEDHEIKSVTGVIKKFVLNIKRLARVTTASAKYQEDTFSNDVELLQIVVDCSKQYESKLVTVNVKEIVEDEGVENVISVHTILKLNADLKQTYDDGSVSELKLVPGEYLGSVEIENASKGTGTTVATYKLSRFIYMKDPASNTGLRITALLLVDADSVFNVTIDRVKSIGGVVELVDSADGVTNAIQDANSKGVAISAIEYSSPINISKEFSISGINYGIPANSGKRAVGGELENETVLSGAINISGDADVIIDGVTFTGSATIKTTDSSRVVIKNSRFVDMNPVAAKEFLIEGKPGTGKETLVQIENCYFGDAKEDASGKMYNLFELTCKLANGSYVKNNRFTKKVCTHNTINIYDVANEAKVSVENNTFEYSGNAIRVGIKGEPACNVNITRNTYLTTYRSDISYAGLLIIQPYRKQTTSFANCVINLSKNINKSGVNQLFYSYAGSEDMQFTEFNIPTVIVNGKTVQAPKVPEPVIDEPTEEPSGDQPGDNQEPQEPNNDQPGNDDNIQTGTVDDTPVIEGEDNF